MLADRLRLLVVEDQEENRELMSELLDGYGYAVVAVESAERGIEELRSRHYDVVIADHWLEGGESGTWLLRTAAREGLLDRTRAIMCSAERRLEGVPRGVPLMKKPIDFAALDHVIRELVASQPRAKAKTRAVFYVTASAASKRELARIDRWRDELVERGVDIAVIDLEKESTSAEADADRVAATPMLVLHGEVACTRLIGSLDETTLDDLLDVVAPARDR